MVVPVLQQGKVGLYLYFSKERLVCTSTTVDKGWFVPEVQQGKVGLYVYFSRERLFVPVLQLRKVGCTCTAAGKGWFLPVLQ